MRRSITLAILAGVVSLVSVVPGSAQSLNLGLCTISGATTYADTLGGGGGGILPEQIDFTMGGDVECSGVSNMLGGVLTAEGQGTVSCILEITQGAFRIDFSTGETTREVWVGQFASAGSAIGAVIGNLNYIANEELTFNEETQEEEWQQVGDPWVPNLTAIAGVVLFNSGPDQINGCINDGTTEAGFDATLVFAHAAA